MDSETKLAQMAKEEEYTLFNKILDGKIPCSKVYEDDFTLAFWDIAPTAKTHIVVIPKDWDGLSSLFKAEEKHVELMGWLMLACSKVAKQEGLEEGYWVVVNTGPHAGQTVYHIDLHVIGGEQLGWPATGIPSK